MLEDTVNMIVVEGSPSSSVSDTVTDTVSEESPSSSNADTVESNSTASDPPFRYRRCLFDVDSFYRKRDNDLIILQATLKEKINLCRYSPTTFRGEMDIDISNVGPFIVSFCLKLVIHLLIHLNYVYSLVVATIRDREFAKVHLQKVSRRRVRRHTGRTHEFPHDDVVLRRHRLLQCFLVGIYS